MATLNGTRPRPRSPPGSAAPPTSPVSGCSATLYKLARASGVTAVIDAAAVPYLAGAREALRDGFVSGGTRRNLDWVRPHTDLSRIDEAEALLLADAQTSGGLLLVGEIPGAPVIGELVTRGDSVLTIR